MKSQKKISYFSLGLSTILFLGSSITPIKAKTSFNHISSSEILNNEVLLSWGFSGRSVNAPNRRSRGFRRGGCLTPGETRHIYSS